MTKLSQVKKILLFWEHVYKDEDEQVRATLEDGIIRTKILEAPLV